MLPGFELSKFALEAGPIAAVLVIMVIIYAESGLLIGFFLPGDSLLFTAGFLVQNNVLNFPIHSLVLLVFVAAVLGDSTGYYFGRKFGPALFKRPNSLLFRKENVVKAQDFFDTYGGKTIILARFIPVVRTFTPIVAGIAKMNYKLFVTYNIIGGFLWSTIVIYGGFYAGAGLKKVGVDVDTIILPIVAAIILISVAPPLIHIFKKKSNRDTFRKSLTNTVHHYKEKFSKR